MTSRLWSCETLAKGVTMVAQTEQRQEATLDEKIQAICLCKWTDEVLPFMQLLRNQTMEHPRLLCSELLRSRRKCSGFPAKLCHLRLQAELLISTLGDTSQIKKS